MQTFDNLNGKVIENNYEPVLSIDLGKKITKIRREKNQEENKYEFTKLEETRKNNVLKILIFIVLLCVSSYILYYICKNTEQSNRVKNVYRQELNKILKLCEEKMVRVNDKLDTENTRIVDVKDFGEIAKVSEELLKPILYWDSPENDEAWFYIIGEKATYRYVLKAK